MKITGQRLLMLLTGTIFFVQAKSQLVFNSLDALLRYTATKSISLQSGHIRLQKAQKAKLAAMVNIPAITGGLSGTYTNNTKLPVNLFPGEAFGGQAGTYKEVQTGVQYVTNLNESIDVKLLNLQGWANLKLAKLNIAAAAADITVTLKSLQESIATVYFTIVNLQEQLAATKQNLAAADTLLQITQQRYLEGLVKQQDVNDAQVNQLSIQESIRQIVLLIRQQYINLKLYGDIPETEDIVIGQKVQTQLIVQQPSVQLNHLQVNSSMLKEKAAFANYRQLKYALYPTVSFFQAYTTQQYNTRGKLFDSRVNWIPSSYVGIKVHIPIPGAQAFAQASGARYDYMLAQKETEQQKVKAGLEQQQLLVDYEQSVSQAQSNKAIYALRIDTYQKNQSLYREGLIGLDQALASFNALVTGGYNLISANVNVLLAKAKIDIHNTIQ